MRIPLTALLLACCTALPAAAEKADREKAIVLNADRSVGNDATHVIEMEGNVVVTQGTMRITAARLVVKEDAQRFKHYTATGSPVTFRQKRDNADEWVEGFAQRAEFDEKSDMLKLYDKARVKSNQNEITGEFISYDMTGQVAEVLGAPPGQKPPEGSRVKVIIVPSKKGERGTPPPPVSPKLKADAEVK